MCIQIVVITEVLKTYNKTFSVENNINIPIFANVYHTFNTYLCSYRNIYIYYYILYMMIIHLTERNRKGISHEIFIPPKPEELIVLLTLHSNSVLCINIQALTLNSKNQAKKDIKNKIILLFHLDKKIGINTSPSTYSK